MLLGLLFAGRAEAQGIAARFDTILAVERRPLEIAVEIEDPIGVVGRVRLLLRVESSEELPVEAVRDPKGQRFVGTYPAEILPPPGHTVSVKAEILGRRGGLLSVIGEDEPLVVTVVSAPEGAAIASHFRAAEQVRTGAYVVGEVGSDVRVGSNARIRGLVGAHFRVARLVEVGFLVAVGPVFEPLARFAEHGPIVVGFELSPRIYLQNPVVFRLAPYVEPAAVIDLRLPGLDLGAGVRAGITYRLGGAASFDASIGGAAMAFSLSGEDEVGIGFTGGLRLSFRFEGSLEDEPGS